MTKWLLILLIPLMAFTWHEKKTVTLEWDRSTSEQDSQYADCEFYYDVFIGKSEKHRKLVGTTQTTSFHLPISRQYAGGALVGVRARAVCGPNEFTSDISWSTGDNVNADKGKFRVRYPASRGVSMGGGVSMN